MMITTPTCTDLIPPTTNGGGKDDEDGGDECEQTNDGNIDMIFKLRDPSYMLQ